MSDSFLSIKVFLLPLPKEHARSNLTSFDIFL